MHGGATTLRATPQARRHVAGDAAIARHVDQQPPSSDYLAFLSHVSAPAANATSATAAVSAGSERDRAVQAKLDAVRDAFSGPYVVAGAQVTAHPMFRMATHTVAPKLVAEVHARAQTAHVNPGPAMYGRATPKELVKITQALIDAGGLPAGPGDVATRIRKMQWDHGIGVDCAGYSYAALKACSANPPKLYAPGMESFRDLDGARAGAFAKQPIIDARPGDLITLDAIKPEVWGHNVVVYSHVTVGADQRADLLAAANPDVRAFLASSGPHHVIEVDSSWGAGAEGADHGGFRRDTWLYDESSKMWGSFTPGTRPAQFVTSPHGPANDQYHGTYRPR